jgi:hypothetical protein
MYHHPGVGPTGITSISNQWRHIPLPCVPALLFTCAVALLPLHDNLPTRCVVHWIPFSFAPLYYSSFGDKAPPHT